MKPMRVQLRRAKGWRMPPNTVKVARPSRWGNPFPLSGFSREEAVRRYRLHAEVMAREAPEWWLDELRGKNLACWCGPGPCHADVLLELANRPVCEAA